MFLLSKRTMVIAVIAMLRSFSSDILKGRDVNVKQKTMLIVIICDYDYDS